MNTFPIRWDTGAPAGSFIRGLSWPVKRIPVFNTIVHKSPSGASVTIPLYIDPLWHFELTYTAIPRGSTNSTITGPPAQDVDILTSFWLLQQGPAYPFLFQAPSPTSASLTSFYTCRFSDDNGLELDDFTNTLTALGSLKLEEVRLPG